LSVANPTFETECLHGLEEQKPCWIASRGRGYFDKDGKLLRLIGVSMDVTERKNSARSLQEQREQLAHVDRVSIMGQLASSLAHELNQPLGAILRNAEAAELFLRKDPPNLEELRAILADIRHDDERAGAVIDRMKALLQRRKFQIVAISLPVLFEEVISLAEPDATARQVQLRVEVDPNTPIVMGDRVQLQQVLLNLIINAIDAINSCDSASRCVVVGAAAKQDGVEVFVLDSGPGILPELLPRVFEPFFTTKENGMGVGLPICRSIIEVHGGRIWGENNAESGATFRFTLPLSSGAEELAEVTGTGSPAGADTRGEPVTAPVYSI
jgi:two-component system, LuxR family, sensor kinase FixL